LPGGGHRLCLSPGFGAGADLRDVQIAARQSSQPQ
jgi:hypothetical protein